MRSRTGGSPSPSTSDGLCQGHGIWRDNFPGLYTLALRKMKGMTWLWFGVAWGGATERGEQHLESGTLLYWLVFWGPDPML